MLTVEQTNRAINAGLGDGEHTPDRLLAAIEGALMGQAYLEGRRANAEEITINSLASLVEGVERLQRAEKLGLDI